MSVFREVLLFLDGVGVYDVVLPLLLIFSIVYAILDKTHLFGTEKVGNVDVPRKNINAMVAFVTAFFFVASAQLVQMVNALVSQVALVIVIFVMFMILIGTFTNKGNLDGDEDQRWRKTFMWISAVAIALIFLNAIGWLMPLWYYVSGNWDSTFVAIIILLGLMVAFMLWVTSSKTPQADKQGKS